MAAIPFAMSLKKYTKTILLVLMVYVAYMILMSYEHATKGAAMKMHMTDEGLGSNWTQKLMYYRKLTAELHISGMIGQWSLPVADQQTINPILAQRTLVQTTFIYDQGSDANITFLKKNTPSKSKICIGGGLTSRKVTSLNGINMKLKLNLFKDLMPSFCQTASQGFEYHFYFGIDFNEPLYRNLGLRNALTDTFTKTITTLCQGIDVHPQPHLVKCSYTGQPSWAFNDAFYQAYLDGMDYFYHVNDDTMFTISGWTEDLVSTLQGLDPTNVGVAGPTNQHKLLSYHMVHRKHWEIFGYFYPRVFGTWWSDTWIMKVYQPNRSIILDSEHLKHTYQKGKRYSVNSASKTHLQSEVSKGKDTLQRYISAVHTQKKQAKQNQYIISMTLYNKKPAYTAGVIRNAQLVSVIYPGWTLRVYMASPSEPNSTCIDTRVIETLKGLKAQMIFVKNVNILPKYWNYLVADDETVEYFLIRNVDARLSEREAEAVSDWMQYRSDQSWNKVAQSTLYGSLAGFHCIRDRSQHSSHSVIDGLWGAYRTSFIQALSSNMTSLLDKRKDYDVDILETFIWEHVKSTSYCHDSVTKNTWTNSHQFPSPNNGSDFIGQKYNVNQERIKQ